LVQARSWDESHRIVCAHPELLDRQAVVLLARLRDVAREQDESSAAVLFEEHRALLVQCQELGLVRAFADKLGCSIGDLAAGSGVAEQPSEVRELLQEMAREGVQLQSPDDLARVLRERPEWGERLQTLMNPLAGLPKEVQ
ncbi:unnamed protein product, partial [marine sediment metagenome]